MYILATDSLLLTVTLTNERPVLSSPHMDRTVNIKQDPISGHEPLTCNLLSLLPACFWYPVWLTIQM
jgi:hypothetical protein